MYVFYFIIIVNKVKIIHQKLANIINIWLKNNYSKINIFWRKQWILNKESIILLIKAVTKKHTKFINGLKELWILYY